MAPAGVRQIISINPATKRSTAITMGGGVKRYFVSDANDYGIQRILPTVRLTVGYAFR